MLFIILRPVAARRPVECEPRPSKITGAFSASQTCVPLLKRFPLRLNLAIRHTRAKSGAANGFARFELQITQTGGQLLQTTTSILTSRFPSMVNTPFKTRSPAPCARRPCAASSKWPAPAARRERLSATYLAVTLPTPLPFLPILVPTLPTPPTHSSPLHPL